MHRQRRRKDGGKASHFLVIKFDDVFLDQLRDLRKEISKCDKGDKIEKGDLIGMDKLHLTLLGFNCTNEKLLEVQKAMKNLVLPPFVVQFTGLDAWKTKKENMLFLTPDADSQKLLSDLVVAIHRFLMVSVDWSEGGWVDDPNTADYIPHITLVRRNNSGRILAPDSKTNPHGYDPDLFRKLRKRHKKYSFGPCQITSIYMETRHTKCFEVPLK